MFLKHKFEIATLWLTILQRLPTDLWIMSNLLGIACYTLCNLTHLPLHSHLLGFSDSNTCKRELQLSLVPRYSQRDWFQNTTPHSPCWISKSADAQVSCIKWQTTVSPPYPWVLHLQSQSMVGWIHGWETQIRKASCTLCPVFLCVCVCIKN